MAAKQWNAVVPGAVAATYANLAKAVRDSELAAANLNADATDEALWTASVTAAVTLWNAITALGGPAGTITVSFAGSHDGNTGSLTVAVSKT